MTSGHCSHKPAHKLPAVIGFLNPVKQKSPVAKLAWIALITHIKRINKSHGNVPASTFSIVRHEACKYQDIQNRSMSGYNQIADSLD